MMIKMYGLKDKNWCNNWKVSVQQDVITVLEGDVNDPGEDRN